MKSRNLNPPAPMGDDLLEVALILAKMEQTASPRQAFLRRAVSTAYYAVFQSLAARCASALVTFSGSDSETYTLVFRGLEHASARKMFEAKDILAKFGPEIEILANAFVILQRAPIGADHVPGPFPFGQSKVAEHIEQARDACEIVQNIPLPIMRRLAAQLIVKRR